MLQSRASGASSVPQLLQSTLPTCAQQCVSSYIPQLFPNCVTDDLTCLCTGYGSQDYTLGEVSYLCVQTSCQNDSAGLSSQVAAYNICKSQAGAVANKHTVLVLPTATTLSPTSTTTKTVVSSGGTTTGGPTSNPATTTGTGNGQSTTALPGSGAGVGWTATTTVTVSDAAATTTGTSSQHGGSTSLSSAQAVGVSLAAFGTLFLLVLIIWLCLCCRRRKSTKQVAKSEPFDSKAEVRRRTWKPRMGVTQIRASLNIRQAPPAANDSEMSTAPWVAQRTPRGASSKSRVEPIRGMRPTSSTNRPASRWSHKSAESNGSVAHLLPTKRSAAEEETSRGTTPPAAGVPHKSPKITANIHTPATVFEEDQSTFVPGLPANPAAGLRTAPVRPDRSQQPPLSLAIPKPLSKPVAKPTAMPWPAPPAPVHSSSSFLPPSFAYPAQNLQPQPIAAPANVIHSTGPHNRQASSSPRMRSTTPDQGPSQTRRVLPPALTISKVATRQRAVRHSTASDTSFESLGDDEPTPPEQEKHLTPVAEMSPISAVRYPKIPRSTNQAVPRSPAQVMPPRPLRTGARSPAAAGLSPSTTQPTTPTTSVVGDRQAWSPNGTTLARSQGSWAKGDDVMIRTQNGSPLLGYGLGMRMRPASPTMSQSSKLAPSLRRQGDDLYLGVKVGSPVQSQFARQTRPPNMI
jgi:hypothetical protein